MAQTNLTKGIVFKRSFSKTQLFLCSMVDKVYTDQEVSNPQASDIIEALRNTQRNQTI